MPGPNSTNLFSWTQWSNQSPAGWQELGPHKHNAMAQNQMWHMSEHVWSVCAHTHAPTETHSEWYWLMTLSVFSLVSIGWYWNECSQYELCTVHKCFFFFNHRRKESIAWFSEEMKNCRSRSFTPVSERESHVGISTSNCCIENKGRGGWKRMTHGKKPKNYKEEYWRHCVWNSGSLKHKEKWQESWIWAQICMDAVCTLNKLVFRNKCISVFKHKPYAIEVLALC